MSSAAIISAVLATRAAADPDFRITHFSLEHFGGEKKLMQWAKGPTLIPPTAIRRFAEVFDLSREQYIDLVVARLDELSESNARSHSNEVIFDLMNFWVDQHLDGEARWVLKIFAEVSAEHGSSWPALLRDEADAEILRKTFRELFQRTARDCMDDPGE